MASAHSGTSVGWGKGLLVTMLGSYASITTISSSCWDTIDVGDCRVVVSHARSRDSGVYPLQAGRPDQRRSQGGSIPLSRLLRDPHAHRPRQGVDRAIADKANIAGHGPSRCLGFAQNPEIGPGH